MFTRNVVGWLRFLALLILGVWKREKVYARTDHGWFSWIELPLVGLVAFRDVDGNLCHRW